MTTSFNPSVVIPGTNKTVEVPGWMYVLAFALRGIPWAMEEADKPEFRVMVSNYAKEQKNQEIMESIRFHLEAIDKIRELLT